MSRIVIGVGASHSTLMNTHWDDVVHRDDAERFRDGLLAARDRVAAAQPDVAIIVGSNHFRGFWLDLLPQFTIGVGDVEAAGDGGTPRGPQRVDPAYARAVAAGVVEAGFDPAISARLQIDHGQAHAIQYLLRDLEVPVVPVVVNVFAAPLPTMSRCVGFGTALAEAIAAVPDDRRVAVIASGGLSHQLPWPSDWSHPEGDDEEFLVDAWINGRGEWERFDPRRRSIITSARPTIFEDFDRGFLSDLEAGKLERLADISTAELERVAGNGGQELRTWMILAATMGFRPGTALAYAPMPEWLTGMGVAVYDELAG
jgi:2,3-dihydroxyphenylpropionate 1,2-dioxygenase